MRPIEGDVPSLSVWHPQARLGGEAKATTEHPQTQFGCATPQLGKDDRASEPRRREERRGSAKNTFRPANLSVFCGERAYGWWNGLFVNLLSHVRDDDFEGVVEGGFRFVADKTSDLGQVGHPPLHIVEVLTVRLFVRDKDYP